MSVSISDIQVRTNRGEEKSLVSYEDQVLLIVNVASQCGYTPQYAELEAVYRRYKDRGFRVLAFPCNDFGAQEPGSNEEIAQFCQRSYGVSFELFDKVHAIGADRHPLYERLSEQVAPKGDVKWNFEKFLVDKKGNAVARFSSGVKPDDPAITGKIEELLAE